MNTATNVVLGVIAGVTIFLGLPVARWRTVSDRTRGLLTLASVGVILFLVIEVGFQAMQRVEAAALSRASATVPGLLLLGGLALGLVGLAWLEDVRRSRLKGGAEPLDVATMVAIGIGLHNFTEGLAIGQSFSSGAIGLGTVLVTGFALHNATEGFGIAGPLAGQAVSWRRLIVLGFIGGGPTVLGSLIGGLWVNASLELLFLATATGSLIYVTRELFRIRFATLQSAAAMGAVTLGLCLGFGTELIVDVGQARLSTATTAAAATSVRFTAGKAEPESLSLERGESLEIRNDSSVALVFEGNGLFVGEVAVPASDSIIVRVTGLPGDYRLVDERGSSGATAVRLQPGVVADPLLEKENALGALTILEGHVRAAKELRDRGIRGEGPSPDADLKRAPTHATHPQKELLHGAEPDALALQRFLRQQGLLDSLDATLTTFVENAGSREVSAAEFNESYLATLDSVERARKIIGGEDYQRPAFRAAVIRFVLETAAGEYGTAAQGGRITVNVAGVPGEDAFIEYQDARAFIMAAHELLRPLESRLAPEALQALDSLDENLFKTLDPPEPEAPVPPAAVQLLIRSVTDALPQGD